MCEQGPEHKFIAKLLCIYSYLTFLKRSFRNEMIRLCFNYTRFKKTYHIFITNRFEIVFLTYQYFIESRDLGVINTRSLKV